MDLRQCLLSGLATHVTFSSDVDWIEIASATRVVGTCCHSSQASTSASAIDGGYDQMLLSLLAENPNVSGVYGLRLCGKQVPCQLRGDLSHLVLALATPIAIVDATASSLLVTASETRHVVALCDMLASGIGFENLTGSGRVSLLHCRCDCRACDDELKTWT